MQPTQPIRTMRNRITDLGRERARYLCFRFGNELRIARVSAGLTQRRLAIRAGVSQQFISLAERGLRAPSWNVGCRLAAAAGAELSLRLFPAQGVGLRDSGQLELAEWIAAAAHSQWRIRLEEPLGDGSRRAIDMALDHPEELGVLEIEGGFADFQAQLRAATLKREALAARSDRPVRLIIAAPDLALIRRALSAHGELIRRALPVPSREIWRALRDGSPVGGDGILLIPRPSRRVRRLIGPLVVPRAG